MILVTVGTQDKPFTRLLDSVQKCINTKQIKSKVVVQAGYTKYESKDMKIFDLVSREEFDKLLDKCDILIAHGGVGSIVGALKKGKTVIAIPRLSKYHEHENDHQIQIVNNFSAAGYIIKSNGDDLDQALQQAKTFKPKKYISNTDNIIKIVQQYIDNN